MPFKQQRFRLSCQLALIVFALFQKSLKHVESADESPARDHAEPDFSRIRCPLCHWRPRASSRWFCDDCGYPEHFFDGCGTTWNTFNTRGLCPGCAHQWRWTACLRCDGWSLHEAWYLKQGEANFSD